MLILFLFKDSNVNDVGNNNNDNNKIDDDTVCYCIGSPRSIRVLVACLCVSLKANADRVSII